MIYFKLETVEVENEEKPSVVIDSATEQKVTLRFCPG